MVIVWCCSERSGVVWRRVERCQRTRQAREPGTERHCHSGPVGRRVPAPLNCTVRRLVVVTFADGGGTVAI